MSIIQMTVFNPKLQRISVAPMLDWTTRDYRYFARLLNRHVWLYTEMISTGAILKGDSKRYLTFDKTEQPIALQLGGSNIKELAECSRIGEHYGYDEINLNVGCPSDRVQHHRIGACLMAEPAHVAECVSAMQAAVNVPVTVKHRIGIDHLDRYEDMLNFVDTVAAAGCRHFIVHARTAWLNGLSPKENREVPPLRYADVYRLKMERPSLTIEINGGIATVDEVKNHLAHTDGVMIGRAAYHNVYILADLLNDLWEEEPLNRFEVLEAFYPYVAERLAQGLTLNMMTRHILGLFQNQAGARKWRQALSGHQVKTLDDLREAVKFFKNI